MAFTEEEEQGLRAMLKLFKTQAPSLSDDAADIASGAYPAFDLNGHDYASGERVLYDGVLYTCLQPHKSQSDWTPTAAPSLWAQVLESGTAETPADEIPEWVQPSSTNPYPLGARVKHNGRIWESIVANNVWEPGATGTSTVWKDVTEEV